MRLRIIMTILLLTLGVFVLLFVSGCASQKTSFPPKTPVQGNSNDTHTVQSSTLPTFSQQDEPGHLQINASGSITELLTNSRGEVVSDVQIGSSDGKISLFIESGTSFLDKNGKPVYSIDIKINPGSPYQPENASIIGIAYEFTPSGTTCSRPVKLILKYSPDSLLPNIEEDNVYIACFSNGKWNNVNNTLINTGENYSEAQIDHFCWYAILAPLPSNSIPTVSPSVTPPTSNKVDLLYFHPTSRCTTCKYFEERTRYVMATYFQKEVESGQLTLTLYDYLDKANADLVKKYQVVGSQLFVQTTINGSENTRNIWEIYQWGSNKEAYDKELQAIIQESLRSTK